MGQFHDGLREVSTPRVDDMFDSQHFQQGTLGRTPGGGDDLGTQMMSNLNRRHPHSACTRVDEDDLAGPNPGNGLQRIPRSHEDHRKSRCFFERQTRGHPAHIGGSCQRVRGQAENGETKHPVSGRQMTDSLANRDLTGHFVAKNARIRGLAG